MEGQGEVFRCPWREEEEDEEDEEGWNFVGLFFP